MKKNIAIIMGGYSSEYLISLKSGKVVYESLPAKLYNCYCIHIFKDKWVYVNEFLEEFSVDKSDFTISLKELKLNLTVFLMQFTALRVKTERCRPISNYYHYLIQAVICTKQHLRLINETV